MKATELSALLNGIGTTVNPKTIVNDVVIDSRRVKQGNIFVAIKGDNFDGNDYVKSAFESGACAAVVDRLQPDCTGEQILVSDTRDALRRIAGNYRSLFNVTAVGVTGSVGKTTTKEMTAAMLSRFGKTLKTIGNLNNQIGLPMTMFRLDDSDKYAAIELGMTNFGEIGNLSRILKPKIGIITHIGISHIEYLKTQENILHAKLEITDGMPEDGIVVLNGSDPLLMSNRHLIKQQTVTFSADESSGADVVASNICQSETETEFIVVDRAHGSFRARIPAIGKHNVQDAVAAYTAVTRLGLDPETAIEGLMDYKPSGMRQNIVCNKGVTVIEDCYNAAPESMRASLGILAEMPCSGIRIAVLGDMNELGSETVAQHKLIGMEVARRGIDVLLCRGDKAKFIAESAKAAGVTCVEWFDSNMELADYLRRTASEGDCILFKASRTMTFEEIIENFYRR